MLSCMNSQKDKGLQFPQRRRNGPWDIVVVQIQTDKAPQVTKLIRDASLNIVFIKFPASWRIKEVVKLTTKIEFQNKVNLL